MFEAFDQVLSTVRSGFGGKRILVVGDVMLDRYVWGDVSRISPEAPVPIVRVSRTTETPGGAGNVALNAAGLGAKVSLCGVTGADSERERLLKTLSDNQIETSAIVAIPGRATITKTRIIGGHQQMLRCDVEDRAPLSADAVAPLKKVLEAQLNTAPDAIILSDYAKGVLSAELCQWIIGIAAQKKIPLLADPKGRDFTKYRGAFLLSPNRSELAEATATPSADLDGLHAAGARLVKELNLSAIALTLSELGIALIQSNKTDHFPAMAREVYDVSGAGDTVIATIAASLAAGLSLADATHLSNLAAGIVVGKIGTVPVKRDELLNAVSAEEAHEQFEKVCDLPTLLQRAELWRKRGERIVFTNGCFDLLHFGHVDYLRKARREGNRLVIGLNTDRSVRALKGPTRPLIPERERAHVLAALECCDAVILFDEDTPLKLIEALRPHVLAKGADYTEDKVVGGKEVKSWGGRVALIAFVEGLSTSNIVKKIEKNG
jgi:D-beta-D-heptose 7-phosphate kinase / D-beta-D-heptose 1-phosphate adenosyltransferase